ncbi:epoxyqueuosine reductase QueH [Patescibacteria group bacterium]|nr:epoxyqueuosine reductase QueH [Patescibacteria group bacterium]
MKKILLHICCGPCGTASVKRLKEEGHQVTGYYYNPNIHPEDEYERRLKEAKKLSKSSKISLIIDDYYPDEYFELVKGKESSPKERCPECWALRLKKTAEKAKELNIKMIGSTLRISPYQDQIELLKIGQKIAKDYGLDFYDKDLVRCFHESVQISKSEEMYRQKYCGCVFSKEYQ